MKTAQNTIRETSVYDCFKYSPDQRDIKVSHVRDIMESMGLWGFLPSKPLQVYQEGKKFVIVDGHHRFVAAKNLQIPVLFVVESKSHIDSIGSVNGVQRKWKLENFVNMYAKRGIPDYKELIEYSNLGIPFSTAISMLSGQASNGKGNQGNKSNKATLVGNFKVKTREKIDILAAFLRENGHLNATYRSRNFISAFELLDRVPDFEFQKLASKLANNPKTLTKTATTDQMLDQIEEIYNYHQVIKIPLAFMARNSKKSKNQFAK